MPSTPQTHKQWSARDRARLAMDPAAVMAAGEFICPAHGLEMTKLRYRTPTGRVWI
jgi:hypothetical protein